MAERQGQMFGQDLGAVRNLAFTLSKMGAMVGSEQRRDVT